MKEPRAKDDEWQQIGVGPTPSQYRPLHSDTISPRCVRVFRSRLPRFPFGLSTGDDVYIKYSFVSTLEGQV